MQGRRRWVSLIWLICVFVHVLPTFCSRNHTSSAISHFAGWTCRNFMTILAGVMPWSTRNESCEKSIRAVGMRLTVLSTLMQRMNSSLSVYTTFQNSSACRLKKKIPRLKFIEVNATSLLLEYQYGEALKIMQNWNMTGYTRTSDILRLILAHKYQEIYIDSDIHFLNLQHETYMRSFTAAAIWQERENGIEISNSAFCLPRNILLKMMNFQQRRIEEGPQRYFYTELGPSLFQKVLVNDHSIALFSQNNPKEVNITKIVSSVRMYDHKFVHLTSSIRKFYKSGFEMLLLKIRRKLNLTIFDYPRASSYFEMSRLSESRIKYARGHDFNARISHREGNASDDQLATAFLLSLQNGSVLDFENRMDEEEEVAVAMMEEEARQWTRTRNMNNGSRRKGKKLSDATLFPKGASINWNSVQSRGANLGAPGGVSVKNGQQHRADSSAGDVGISISSQVEPFTRSRTSLNRFRNIVDLNQAKAETAEEAEEGSTKAVVEATPAAGVAAATVESGRPLSGETGYAVGFPTGPFSNGPSTASSLSSGARAGTHDDDDAPLRAKKVKASTWNRLGSQMCRLWPWCRPKWQKDYILDEGPRRWGSYVHPALSKACSEWMMSIRVVRNRLVLDMDMMSWVLLLLMLLCWYGVTVAIAPTTRFLLRRCDNRIASCCRT